MIRSEGKGSGLKRIRTALILGTMMCGCCRMVEDLVHMKPPVIESCCLDSSGGRMFFSQEMNRSLTEEAFTLALNNDEKAVVFNWSGDGKSVTFLPVEGVATCGIYLLTVTKEAEDIYGNSLTSDFNRTLSTGSDHLPPQITMLEPEGYRDFSSLREDLCLTFSEPVDRDSFNRAFSISPEILFTTSWNSRDDRVEIRALEDFTPDREYLFSINTELADYSGNRLSVPYEKRYYTPEVPELQLVELTLNGSDITGYWNSTTATNAVISEKDATLEFRFSREPSLEEQHDLVSVLPFCSTDLKWMGDMAVLEFPEELEYGGIYEIILPEGSIFLSCTGEGSVPVSVGSVVFIPDSSTTSRELSLNASMGAVDSDSARLEITLKHSSLSQIDLASFLESFTMSSGVIIWSCLSAQIVPGSGESRISVGMQISGTGLPGTVTLTLDSDLRDTCGNSLTENWSLTVLQP